MQKFLHLQLHLIRMSYQLSNTILLTLKNKHELMVLVALIVGFILFYIVFGNGGYLVRKIDDLVVYIKGSEFDNHLFYVHYLSGFFRSLAVLLTVNYFVKITLSWRLTILMMFLLSSMCLDLIFVLSLYTTESLAVYYAIKPIRYYNAINFQSAYSLFEILCAISIFVNMVRVNIGSKPYDANLNNNSEHSPSWVLHSVINKVLYVGRKEKKRSHS